MISFRTECLFLECTWGHGRARGTSQVYVLDWAWIFRCRKKLETMGEWLPYMPFPEVGTFLLFVMVCLWCLLTLRDSFRAFLADCLYTAGVVLHISVGLRIEWLSLSFHPSDQSTTANAGRPEDRAADLGLFATLLCVMPVSWYDDFGILDGKLKKRLMCSGFESDMRENSFLTYASFRHSNLIWIRNSLIRWTVFCWSHMWISMPVVFIGCSVSDTILPLESATGISTAGFPPVLLFIPRTIHRPHLLPPCHASALYPLWCFPVLYCRWALFTFYLHSLFHSFGKLSSFPLRVKLALIHRVLVVYRCYVIPGYVGF